MSVVVLLGASKVGKTQLLSWQLGHGKEYDESSACYFPTIEREYTAEVTVLDPPKIVTFLDTGDDSDELEAWIKRGDRFVLVYNATRGDSKEKLNEILPLIRKLKSDPCVVVAANCPRGCSQPESLKGLQETLGFPVVGICTDDGKQCKDVFKILFNNGSQLPPPSASKTQEEKFAETVVILGGNKVGKTRLISWHLGHGKEDLDGSPYSPTIEREYITEETISEQKCLVKYLDTGFDDSELSDWIKRGTKFIIVFCLTDKASVVSVRRLYELVSKEKQTSKNDVMILENATTNRTSKQEVTRVEAEELQLEFSRLCWYEQVNASDGTGVSRALTRFLNGGKDGSSPKPKEHKEVKSRPLPSLSISSTSSTSSTSTSSSSPSSTPSPTPSTPSPKSPTSIPSLSSLSSVCVGVMGAEKVGKTQLLNWHFGHGKQYEERTCAYSPTIEREYPKEELIHDCTLSFTYLDTGAYDPDTTPTLISRSHAFLLLLSPDSVDSPASAATLVKEIKKIKPKSFIYGVLNVSTTKSEQLLKCEASMEGVMKELFEEGRWGVVSTADGRGCRELFEGFLTCLGDFARGGGFLSETASE